MACRFSWTGLCRVAALVLLLGLAAAPAWAADDPAACVRPVPPGVLTPRPGSPASADFVSAYYQSIADWGRIVRGEVRPVPGRPGQSYLGLPGNVEDHVRPTAYAAMVLGFLAEFEPPRSALGRDERRAMRSAAVDLLRYLAAGHVTGGGACLDGKPWGNQWQSAMWARAAGMAAWLIWPHLDDDLQTSLARMVEFEADRFIEQPPKSSEHGDTGAEENAWNASVTALAANMMPGHAHAAAWAESSKRYMFNTFSVAADAQDASPGDDGRPIRDWVTTVNAHDDFTVENHSLVHVGYLKTAAAELQENAVHWLVAGRNVPQACFHHLPEVFDVLVDCMAWDGSPVYFGGNDWKVFHSQASDVVVYTVMNVLTSDARAAHLEELSVDWLRRQQESEGGYYNVRRDPEYGGLCATRLIACCLAHAIVGSTTEPVTAAEFDRAACGVRHMASASAIIHRTPTKFASFTWAQKRMALALPREGNWVVWPHFASYLGIINGEDPSDRRARLENLKADVRTGGFRVSGTLVRCKGRLAQDFLYASPTGDYTVYAERLRPQEGFVLASRETGVIGLEYPLGVNKLDLCGEFGTLKTIGYGGQAEVRTLKTNWLNLGGRVGYVVCRPAGEANVMRYHDQSAGAGRVPQLQEWISLVGNAEPRVPPGGSWACVVTLLNRDAGGTAEAARSVRFEAERDRATCQIGEDEMAVEFGPPNE
jgi:hypothetical protein